MRRTIVAAGMLLVAALTACSAGSEGEGAVTSPSPTATARTSIRDARDFVVYYGMGELDALARYDIAIIDPSTLTRDEVAALRDRGTIVVGYLSVGEIEANDPWLMNGTVPRSWILGRNHNWGSLYVDASQQGWRDLMVKQAGELIDEQGFNGVFLDTVDTATDVDPSTAPGMVALIHGLRVAYPDAILIQNRGFELLDQTRADVDALMFEDLSTTYDFDRAEYERIEPDQDLVDRIQGLADGMPVLALDYAEPSDHETASRAVRVARGYGFLPSVSVIALDEVPRRVAGA